MHLWHKLPFLIKWLIFTLVDLLIVVVCDTGIEYSCFQMLKQYFIFPSNKSYFLLYSSSFINQMKVFCLTKKMEPSTRTRYNICHFLLRFPLCKLRISDMENTENKWSFVVFVLLFKWCYNNKLLDVLYLYPLKFYAQLNLIILKKILRNLFFFYDYSAV